MTHSREDCPHSEGPYDHSAHDLNRPNHLAHDILGCPFECDGNHNHPQEESAS